VVILVNILTLVAILFLFIYGVAVQSEFTSFVESFMGMIVSYVMLIIIIFKTADLPVKKVFKQRPIVNFNHTSNILNDNWNFFTLTTEVR
jgi:hypothetical protein